MEIKFKCEFCGNESTAFDMDMDERDIPAYCPHCGKRQWKDREEYGRLVAEHIGVYEFVVNGNWLEYWSFYPGEGFRFVQFDLTTGEENRDGFIPWKKEDGIPVPSFLKEVDANNEALWWCKYNYNIG